jgi:hypothetical protein
MISRIAAVENWAAGLGEQAGSEPERARMDFLFWRTLGFVTSWWRRSATPQPERPRYAAAMKVAFSRPGTPLMTKA